MKKLFRKLRWRAEIKNLFIKIAQDSPFGYPLMVFIEFEGEDLYVEHGFKAYKKILINKLDEIVYNLSRNILSSFEERQKIDNMSDKEFYQYQKEVWDEFDAKQKAERQKEIDDYIEKADLLIKQQLYN